MAAPIDPSTPRRAPLATVRQAILVNVAKLPLALGYHRAEVRVWLQRQEAAQGLSRAQLDRILLLASGEARALVRAVVVATAGAGSVETLERELGALSEAA